CRGLVQQHGVHNEQSAGVEDAFVAPLPGPDIASLPRLEHEYDVAGQVLADSVEQPEAADAAGRVQVVAAGVHLPRGRGEVESGDRKSTRLNSSHVSISYAVFCLKKKKQT